MTNSFPKIRLHGFVPYDRSGKARWLLCEMGIAYEDRWLNRETAEIESPEYLKLNPMGRVPLMEFEGKPMIESGALCAFLADRFPEKRFAPQLDSPLRAEYQQWMYFAASTLDPFQTRIMIIEDIPAGELYSQKFSQLIEEVGDAMETLNIALARSEFMCGQTFTAADICVSYHLFWLKLWPEFLSVMDKYPRVLSYLDRMTARPAASKSEVFSYEV